MSRTWSLHYGKIRLGMPPGRYALAMRRLAQRRRRATLVEFQTAPGNQRSDNDASVASEDEP